MRKVLFALTAAIAFLGMAGHPLAADMETAKIGMCAPLSGPAAAWGLPGVDGLTIFVDKVNAKGGLKVGDKSYKLEIAKYDDEGDGAKALLGVKKLVQEDKVKVVLMLGGGTTPPTQPFLTKEKIMCLTLIGSDCAPDRPYLMDLTDNFPVYHLLHPMYLAKAKPNFKRAAIIAQDDPIGLPSIAWSDAGFKAAGIEVVYSKAFAVNTTDFAPIVTAVLATKPDIICMGASYPEFQALIAEQGYTQGFKGVYTSACWDFSAIAAKVPKEHMEGSVSSFPVFNDPSLTPEHHAFYAEWKKRWPDHTWSEITWEFGGNAEVWAWAVQKAGTFDTEAVLKALKSSETVPHSFGPGKWFGKEVWGSDNLLAPLWPVTAMVNGKETAVDKFSAVDWISNPKNKEILIQSLNAWKIPVLGK